MTDVFMKVFNMSLNSVWIILFVILLRLIFKKCPKNIICIMWGICALSLLIPFSFESPLSVAPKTVVEVSEAAPSVPVENIPSREPSRINFVVAHNNMPQKTESINYAPSSTGPELSEILSFIWLSVLLLMILYAIITYLRLRLKTRISVEISNGIYLNDNISTPFLLGIVSPKIYLPSNIEPSNTLYVVDHESSHYKHLDHIWKPLGFVVLAVHWFNPLVWVAYILLCRDIEYACDERVIKNKDTGYKKGYSLAMLSLSAPKHVISACPVAFGESGVKKRIKSVLSYKKPKTWIILIIILICITSVVCLLSDPVSKRIGLKTVDKNEIKKELSSKTEKEGEQFTDTDDNGIESIVDENEPIEDEDTTILPPQPSVTFEELLSEYSVYSFGYLEDNNTELEELFSENLIEDPPDKYAVTFDNLKEFALIIENNVVTEYNNTETRIEAVGAVYKDFKVTFRDKLLLLIDNEHYNYSVHLRFTDEIIAVGRTTGYMTGIYHLFAGNDYTVIGEKEGIVFENYLDCEPTYWLEVKDGVLNYNEKKVIDNIWHMVCMGTLTSILCRESDYDHNRSGIGYIEYKDGEWYMVETENYTIRDCHADYDLQADYEEAYRYECPEIYEEYPKYEDYLDAKSKGLLDERFYYYGKDRMLYGIID